MAVDTATILIIEQGMNEAMEHVNEAMEHVNEKEIDEEKLPEPFLSDSWAIDCAYVEYAAEWFKWSVEEARDNLKDMAEKKDLDFVNKFLDSFLNMFSDPSFSWRADALKKAGLAEE